MSNLLPLLLVLISATLATGSLDILLKDAFQAHGVPPKQVGLLRQQDAVTVTDRRLQFVCGPLDEFHGTRQILEVESGEPASTAWVSKKNGGKGCLLTQLSAQQVVSMRLGAGWTIESIPDALKIHPTVLTYLQQSPQQQQLQRRKHGTYDEKTASEAEEEKEDKSAGVDTSKIDDQKILEHELLVEFGSRVVVGEAEGLWSGIVTSLVTAKLPTTASGALAGKPWNKLVEKYLLHSPSSFASVSVECSQALKRASVELRSHSLIFSSVEHHSTTCLVALVRVASQHPSVLRVSMQPKAQLVNYEARGIVQTGGQDDEPYREAGLEGQGQICGVADSGLNDLSCFFVDDSGAYPTQTTNRSGIVEPMRRKVIQYVAHADAVDEEGGHGTHVCGTVAGSSTQEFGKMSGMAPKAKIAFFDIGVTNRDFLKLPAVVDIFGEAYAAGARVHTNSWGNLGGIYGQMSYDVDEYAYSHPDFLIVFAAGNSGDLGGKSVISPGNSKNTLSVGAAQVRTVLSDEPRTYAAGNTALAYFSSIGPTCDGRMKPDVVAPGDFIESAFSGPPSILQAAIDAGSDWNGHESCAVHQMSGTSMAAPVAAGTALLLRQYFMDPTFWSAACNKAYQFCKDGAFTPSGYFLKAVMMHSGHAIRRYSDPLFDSAENNLNSFELFAPPDNFQGYGQIHLRSVLPLRDNKGLSVNQQLVVFDNLLLAEHSTLAFDIVLDAKDLKEQPPIKVTVAWYDPPSFVGSVASLLLHDLDLVVHAPNGDLFLGNRGNTAFRLPSTYQTGPSAAAQGNGTTGTAAGKGPEGGWAVLDGEFLDERTDFANPNEQVFIARPLCSASFPPSPSSSSSSAAATTAAAQHKYDGTESSRQRCTYRVYVHANFLPEHPTQAFAAIFTIPRSAALHGPSVATNWVRGGVDKPEETFAPTPAFTVQNLAFDARLAGTYFDKFPVHVPFCTTLQRVQVWVKYDHLEADDSWVANLELTVATPSRSAIAIGGADSSLGLATKITEWPDSWIDSRNGEYYAAVAVNVAELAGVGQWDVFAMNSWSGSGPVWFNVTVVLDFAYAGGDSHASCAPTLEPSPHPTVSPSFSPTLDTVASASASTPSSAAKPHFEHTHSIRFSDVSLGVRVAAEEAAVDSRTHIHSDSLAQNDAVTIDSFNFTGTLEHITLSLDAFDAAGGLEQPMRGVDAWFLAVTVVDAVGLEVQVGGYEWLAQRDRFFVRRWPDPWLGKDGIGRRWVAQRDVHAAGLQGCRKPWTHPKAPSSSSAAQANSSSPYVPSPVREASQQCPPRITSTTHRGDKDEWVVGDGTEQSGMWLPAALADPTAKQHGKSSGKRSYAGNGDVSGGSEPPSFPPTAVPTESSSLSLPLGPALRRRTSDWIVRLSFGYPWGLHRPVNFSGSLQLTFRTQAKGAEEEALQDLFAGGDSWDGSDTPPQKSNVVPTRRPTKMPKSHRDRGDPDADADANGSSSTDDKRGKDKDKDKDSKKWLDVASSEQEDRQRLIWRIGFFLVGAWVVISIVLIATFTAWCSSVRREGLGCLRFLLRHVVQGCFGVDTRDWLADLGDGVPGDAQNLLSSSNHGLLRPTAHDPNATYPSNSTRARKGASAYGSVNV